MIRLINITGPEELYAAARRELLATDSYDEFRTVRGGTFEEIKAKAIELGVDVIEAIDCTKECKITAIESAFVAACEAGVETTFGYTMRASFEDALTVRQAAEYLQRVGGTTMSLRDVDNVLHEGVTVADCLTVADEMAAKGLELWNTREAKKKAVRAASSKLEILQINW